LLVFILWKDVRWPILPVAIRLRFVRFMDFSGSDDPVLKQVVFCVVYQKKTGCQRAGGVSP
jgi:hypothetical protein